MRFPPNPATPVYIDFAIAAITRALPSSSSSSFAPFTPSNDNGRGPPRWAKGGPSCFVSRGRLRGVALPI
jgi:hypothetical protein